jgi:hypothetical protein
VNALLIHAPAKALIAVGAGLAWSEAQRGADPG